MNKNIYFLSFGGGTQNYYDALDRICNQAEQLNIFKEIFKITDNDLKNDNEFWNKHKKFIENNNKGFGYWLWKSYIIKKTLEKINNDDILIYLDCGCEINIKQKNKFLKLIEKLNDKNILSSNASSNDIRYTKKDILDYFNFDIIKDKELLEKKQMQPGTLFLKKNNIIINFINEWYEICSNNYHLIDDSKSISKNLPEFKSNKHDQSIFNCLLKKKYIKLFNYDLNPVNFSLKILNKAKKYPILAIRNRDGKSYIS